MKNTAHNSAQQNTYRVLVTETFTSLVQLKKNKDKTSFNKQFLAISPELKKYIVNRLNSAIKKGHFSKNKYNVDDVLDQLFIEVYDAIDQFDNEDEFYIWLFKQTNQLLDDMIDEEKFDDQFLKNIDDYSKPEWDEMQEHYSTDGGGDLLLIEELDDMSYNHNDYTLNDVFIEDKETGLIDKIDKGLSD
ncbi:sigma-70 family RNA polymerase sigma factor [Flavobacteriaceae bacterium F08102]|nr:sigma-70 family RNA polymerase sigma factor [Flavobacteriaceae bacterium F08102]